MVPMSYFKSRNDRSYLFKHCGSGVSAGNAGNGHWMGNTRRIFPLCCLVSSFINSEWSDTLSVFDSFRASSQWRWMATFGLLGWLFLSGSGAKPMKVVCEGSSDPDGTLRNLAWWYLKRHWITHNCVMCRIGCSFLLSYLLNLRSLPLSYYLGLIYFVLGMKTFPWIASRATWMRHALLGREILESH